MTAAGTGRRASAGITFALVVLLAGAGVAVAASAGSAPPTDPEGHYLHVRTDAGQSRFVDLSPGERATWYLAITADPPDVGTIARSLRVDGPLAVVPGALLLDVTSCDQPFVGGTCPGRAQVLVAPTPVDRLAATGADLGPQQTEDVGWLAVAATLAPDAGEDAQGRSVTVSIGARGESLTAAFVPGNLPRTGTGVGGALALAVVAVGAGLLLSALARKVAHP